MKTTYSLTLSLVFFAATCSYAQTTGAPHLRKANHTMATTDNGGAPPVTVGTIETPVTSREKVLAYPRLLVQQLNCEVTGFDFALTANGKTWGPVSVKGAAFDEEVKNKVKETEPDNVKISITNIHVSCNGGAETIAKPINIEYHY